MQVPMKKSRGRIRVILAESSPIMCEGLRDLLAQEPDIRIAGTAVDGHEALRLLARTRPHVMIVDLGLQGVSGLEVLQRLQAEDKNTHVLVLAAARENQEIAEALRLGARGFVLREYPFKTLVLGIRNVAEGRYWAGQEAVAKPGRKLRGLGELPPAGSTQPIFGLTKRELEIVSAIVSGHSNKEIARICRISEDTVKHHVTNIFDKVGVYNRLELALSAIHHGLVGGR